MKRLVAFLLIALLVLSGCATPAQEETAAPDEYVEGDAREEIEQDLPQRVENPDIEGSEFVDDPLEDDEPDDNEPGSDDPTDDPVENEPNNNEPSKEPDDGEDEPDVEYDSGNQLKIISYNIRYCDDPDGHSIDDRAPRLKTLIDKYEPDLIGFQEATPRWIDHIYDDYGDKYEIRYKYRAESNEEATPLLFKKSKFELLDEGYFWLSETPDVESKAWGAAQYRICMWVKLRIKSTNKELLYYNTHFDGTNESHIGSGKLVVKHATEKGGFSKYPVFLTGDFNMIPWSDGYSTLINGGFSDINEDLEQDKSVTTDGYNKGDNGRIFDYVFYSSQKVTPLKYQVLNEKIYDGYVSDHRGLYTESAII